MPSVAVGGTRVEDVERRQFDRLSPSGTQGDTLYPSFLMLGKGIAGIQPGRETAYGAILRFFDKGHVRTESELHIQPGSRELHLYFIFCIECQIVGEGQRAVPIFPPVGRSEPGLHSTLLLLCCRRLSVRRLPADCCVSVRSGVPIVL